MAFRHLKKTLDETRKNWLTIKTEKTAYKINPKEFAKGSYGTVHEASDSKLNTVAAKAIKRESPKIEHLKDDLEKLIQLDHSNIVRMVDGYMNTDKFWIFMQYCSNGDLNNYLRTRKLSVEELIDQIFIPCAEGLTYLHGQNVIHRDIKPDNILVEDNGCVKLADFDLCKILEEDYMSSSMLTSAGTPMFKAPEFFMGQKYKRSVDNFALGLTFLAAVQNNWKQSSGRQVLVPYCEDESLKDGQRNLPVGSLLASREDLVTVASEEKNLVLTDVISRVKVIISQMTRVKPEERPTAAEVLEKLKRILEQQLKIKLVKSGTWKVKLALSMCANKRDQLVTCGDLSSSINEPKHILTVYNRKDGTEIKQIPLRCGEGVCSMMEHPTKPNYVLHGSRGGTITAVNLDTGEEKTVYKMFKNYIWWGPTGSVLTHVRVSGFKRSEIVQLEWQSEKEEFRAVPDVKLDPQVQLQLDQFRTRIGKMCYVESTDILVCASSIIIEGIRLRDGSRVWELSGAVAGKDIHPWGLCSDPDGHVYVADGPNSRIFVLDGESGSVLQVVLEEEELGHIYNICWSDIPPQLTAGGDDGKISYFTVTTEQ